MIISWTVARILVLHTSQPKFNLCYSIWSLEPLYFLGVIPEHKLAVSPEHIFMCPQIKISKFIYICQVIYLTKSKVRD